MNTCEIHRFENVSKIKYTYQNIFGNKHKSNIGDIFTGLSELGEDPVYIIDEDGTNVSAFDSSQFPKTFYAIPVNISSLFYDPIKFYKNVMLSNDCVSNVNDIITTIYLCNTKHYKLIKSITIEEPTNEYNYSYQDETIYKRSNVDFYDIEAFKLNKQIVCIKIIK